jgi:quercetin dioxygenase-like cupin family protein
VLIAATTEMKGGAIMETIELHGLELLEVWSKADPAERVRFTFPISRDTGATGASVAYAELPSGGAIPRHHDTANEVVLVMEGMVEFEVDGSTSTVSEGQLVQIPSSASHRVANAANETARLLFYFDKAADVVTFEHPLMPLDQSVLGG